MICEKVCCPCCNTMIRKDFLHKHIKTKNHIKNEIAVGIHSDNSILIVFLINNFLSIKLTIN